MSLIVRPVHCRAKKMNVPYSKSSACVPCFGDKNSEYTGVFPTLCMHNYMLIKKILPNIMLI